MHKTGAKILQMQWDIDQLLDEIEKKYHDDCMILESLSRTSLSQQVIEYETRA